jgi:hypothetical protein
MTRHYHRTNLLGWVFVGICAVIVLIYGAATFKNHPDPKALAQLWKQHFTGWKLEQENPSQAEIDHGLFLDQYDGKICTTKGYPGYDPCPPQQYYIDGVPSQPPVETPPETPQKSKSNP